MQSHGISSAPFAVLSLVALGSLAPAVARADLSAGATVTTGVLTERPHMAVSCSTSVCLVVSVGVAARVAVPSLMVLDTYTFDLDSSPSVALAGDTFLVVGEADEEGAEAAAGFRVRASDGSRLDATPFVIATAPLTVEDATVASDGETFLVVYRSVTGPIGGLTGITADDLVVVPVRQDGSVLGDNELAPSFDSWWVHHLDPTIVFDGSSHLVTWRHRRSSGATEGVYGLRIDSDGDAIGERVLIDDDVGSLSGPHQMARTNDGYVFARARGAAPPTGGVERWVDVRFLDGDGRRVGDPIVLDEGIVAAKPSFDGLGVVLVEGALASPNDALSYEVGARRGSVDGTLGEPIPIGVLWTHPVNLGIGRFGDGRTLVAGRTAIGDGLHALTLVVLSDDDPPPPGGGGGGGGDPPLPPVVTCSASAPGTGSAPWCVAWLVGGAVMWTRRRARTSRSAPLAARALR